MRNWNRAFIAAAMSFAGAAVVRITASDAMDDRYAVRAAGKSDDLADLVARAAIDDVQMVAMGDVKAMGRRVVVEIIPALGRAQGHGLGDGVERLGVCAARKHEDGASDGKSGDE